MRINYTYSIRVLFFLISFASVLNLKSQEVTILDKENKLPLRFSNIRHYCINGSDTVFVNKYQTDKNGKVVIINACQNFGFIIVSYVGYRPITSEINKDITIELEPVSIYLNDIVATGNYIPKSSQESLYPVKIISSERIESQKAQNLRDLLSNETNFRINQDAVLGSSVSIGGISGQNIKILIDGVPVIGRLNGNVDLSQINLNNAKRIEIFEGPLSTIYGSDALGGVINIITNTGKNEDKVNVSSFYESVGVYNFNSNISHQFETSIFDLGFGRYFFNGFSLTDNSRDKEWNPKEQYFANLNFTENFEKSRLKATFNYFDELMIDKGELRAPFFETARDDKFQTNRYNIALHYNQEVMDKQFLDITTSYSYFNRTKNTFIKNLVTMNEVLTASESDQDTSIFNSIFFRTTYSSDGYLNNLSYQTGLDINIDNAQGKRINGREQNIEDIAMFLSIQYSPVNNLVIQPAIRGIYNSIFEAPLVPSLNLKYNLSQSFVLRAAYSQGFRSPSIRELHFIFVDINHNIRGNDLLTPENSQHYFLSFDYTDSDQDKVFKIESKIFHNNIVNMIALANLGGSNFTYSNLSEFTSFGTEVNLSYFRDNLTTSLGFNYTGRNNYVSDDVTKRNNVLSYSPELKFNLIYDIKSIDSKISLFYKYTGRQPGFTLDNQGNLQEFFINDFSNLDFIYSFNVSEYNSSLSIGIKNILNVTNLSSNIPINFGVHNSGTNQFSMMWGRTILLTYNYNYVSEN